MRTDQDLVTIAAMKEFGGSFVKQLGETALHADPINLAKIKETWPEYWARYEHQAANADQIRDVARQLRWSTRDDERDE